MVSKKPLLKICILGDAGSPHMIRWVREMSLRGFQVSVITCRDDDEMHTLAEVYPVKRRFGLAGWFLTVPKVRKIIKSIKPDLVHGHYITSYGFWAAACSSNIPVILTAWGSDILVTPRKNIILKTLTKWVLRRSILVTGDSLDILDEVRKLGTGADLEQVQWGVDLEQYKKFDPKRNNKRFQIISLRLWNPIYNIDIILKALSILQKKYREKIFELHLFGGGPLEPDLKQLSDHLNLGKSVVFHGRVDRSDLLKIMQKGNVSVSVPSSDATAMSVLESMAMYLPVIATNLPANKQWLGEKKEGGILVKVQDAEDLAFAIEYYYKNSSEAVKAGKRNRVLVEKEASRKKEMDKMARLYMEIAGLKND